MTQQQSASCEIVGATSQEFLEILTPEAQSFLVALANNFESRRQQCLENRVALQKGIEEGKDLDFLPETAEIRSSDWTVASIPDDVKDRRVEITGPV